jgi:hemerythrin superfamily protein
MATDGITLLKQDHRTVEALFAQYQQVTDPVQRRLVVEEIIRELSIHAAIEEQFLYPAVAGALPDGEQLSQEAIREHQEVKEVLSDLDGMDATNALYDTRVHALIADVSHHVEEEEREMFPRFQKALTKKRLRQMGEAMAAAKLIAPTRPHPKAPDTPPANLVTGPAAAVIDKTRDVVRDVGRRVTRAPRNTETSPAKRITSSRPSPTKPAAKKSTAKRATAKKSTAKKPTAKRSTAKRSTAKRSTARKSTAKKSTAKRSTAQKSTAKRSTAKRSTAKRSTAKKSTARRSTAKKSTAKRSTAKKSTAKRSTAKKSTPRRSAA